MITKNKVMLGIVLILTTDTCLGVLDKQQLFTAATLGNTKKVEKILDTGVDVNSRNITGATALTFGAAHGHPKVVKLLLDRGADVSLKNSGLTPLASAKLGRTQALRKKRYNEVIKLLEDAEKSQKKK